MDNENFDDKTARFIVKTLAVIVILYAMAAIVVSVW